MRFKIVALLVLLLFVPVLFPSVPAFPQDNTPSPDSLNQTIFSKTVTTKDTLVIAMSRDFRPFTFLNAEGQPAGLFVDIWKLWAERSGQTIEFRPSSWQETLDNLKHGHADIHAGLFYSDSRSQWMDFSQPFYGLDIEVFFPVKQGEISGLDELNDQEVGVVGGSHMEEYLRQQYPDIEVVTFRSNEDAARAARDGKIRAFLAGFTETVALLDRLGWSGEFDSIGEVLYTRTFHAGALKGSEELLTLVDQTFNRISNEELAEIERRWIPDPDHSYYRTHSKELRLTAAEEAWLREHRTVRVGMYFLPPFAMFKDDGSFHGIFGDYLALISVRTGIQFDVIPSTTSEIPALAKDRKLDMYPGPEIPGREIYLKYSESFFSLSWCIINRINAPFVSGIRDLEGKTAALHKNTPIRQYITDHYPNIRLYLADDTVQALEAVSTNKADAFIGTLVPASYTIQKQRLTNLKVAAPVDYPDLLMKYAVRNDWPELFTIVNKAIASITPQDHDDIYRNWISLQYEHTVNWTLVWQWIGLIVAISGALLALTLFWNRRLTTEVNERKHAETALARARDELEIRVQERTAELTEANESLQAEITDRKRAEKALRQSELRFRSLIEQTTDAVFCYEYDPPIPIDLPIEEQIKLLYQCVLVECNDICARSYGAARAEEVIGKKLTELFGTAPSSLDDLFRALIQGGYRITDGLGTEVLADGTKRYYLNNGYGVLENGMLLRVWGTFRDVTERKQAEEELKKYREHLEYLVQERTHELETRTKELEAFNKAMVDREMRIIEMKEEVNRLCEELGREPKYPPVWQSGSSPNAA